MPLNIGIFIFAQKVPDLLNMIPKIKSEIAKAKSKLKAQQSE